MTAARIENYSNIDFTLFQSDGDALILFEPDALLAESFYDAAKRRTYLEPEKNLMLAVLEDAVLCFQQNVHAKSQKRKVLFREAEEWFMNQQNTSYFSFETICETLTLDAASLRKGLQSWKEKRSGTTCNWGSGHTARRGIAA